MDQPFIGQINAFGFNFPPRTWATCSGQLLAIAENQALFSLISTYYGGDGRVNFGMPDLRGRMPVGQGQGPGLTFNWSMGSRYGLEFQQLTVNEMPSHTHNATFTPTGSSGPVTVELYASTDNGVSPTPSSGAYLANVIAGGGAADKPELIYRSNAGSGTVPLGGINVSGGGSSGGMVQVQQTGGGNHFPIIQPGLGINYSIALDGLYPQRN